MMLTDCTESRIMAILLATVALVLLVSECAKADTEQPTLKLGPCAHNLNVGPKMNAIGKHLWGSEFVGQDLTGAIFDGCDLNGVRFYQCDLSLASFKKARMTGMRIGDCIISEADFTDAIINGVLSTPPLGEWPHDMHLSEKQLMSTLSYKSKKLQRCLISGMGSTPDQPVNYDFHNAHLEGARLSRGDFRKCNFTMARIDGIEMDNCRITFKQLASTEDFQSRRLSYCRLQGVKVEGKVDLSGVDLTKTVFRGSLLPDADFTDAIITRCTLGGIITREHLYSTRNYKEGRLCGITLSHIDLSRSDLSRQNLTGSKFEQCNFAGANFDDAVISDADFVTVGSTGSTGITIAQMKSTWNFKNGRMKGIILPKEIESALMAR